ncbi:hypothetical protein V6N13_068775 [Hibiscus sabdariffa]
MIPDKKLLAVETAKLVVDGAASFQKAGCGGYLKEVSGNIRGIFSCPLDALGSEYAELMAIYIGLTLVREANWFGHQAIVVESDAKVVLGWISTKEQRHCRWWKIFYELDWVDSALIGAGSGFYCAYNGTGLVFDSFKGLT